ncbi:hypothetical protein GB937_009602 [Aspergillus fischeri]|nr:hypothetical protein GB937_009602 [Aspergillus fischeri]
MSNGVSQPSKGGARAPTPFQRRKRVLLGEKRIAQGIALKTQSQTIPIQAPEMQVAVVCLVKVLRLERDR